MTDEAAFEVHHPRGHVFKVFADGRTSGFPAGATVVINRIPALLTQTASDALTLTGRAMHLPARQAIERAHKIIASAESAAHAMAMRTGCPLEHALDRTMVTWPNLPEPPIAALEVSNRVTRFDK